MFSVWETDFKVQLGEKTHKKMFTKNNNEMRLILPNIKIYYCRIKHGMGLDTKIVEKSRNLKIPWCVYM